MKRKAVAAAICEVSPQETIHCSGSSLITTAATVNGFMEKQPRTERNNSDGRCSEAKTSPNKGTLTTTNAKNAVVEVLDGGICTKLPLEEHNKHREKTMITNGSDNASNFVSSNEKGDLAACQLYRILRLRHRVSPVFLRRNSSKNEQRINNVGLIRRRPNAGGIEEVCKKLSANSPDKKPPCSMNYIQVVLRFTYHGITFNDGFAETAEEATEETSKNVSNVHYTGGKLNLYIYDKSAVCVDLQNVGSLKISLNGNTPVKNGAAKSLAIPLKLPAIDDSDTSFLRATLLLHSIIKNGKNGVYSNGIKAHTKSTSFSWDLALKDILNKTNIVNGATSETEFEMLLNSSTILGEQSSINSTTCSYDWGVKPAYETDGAVEEKTKEDGNLCAIHSYMSSAIGALKFHVGVDVVPNSSNSGTYNCLQSSLVSPSRLKKSLKTAGQRLNKPSLVSPTFSSLQSSSHSTYSNASTLHDQKLYIIFRFPHKSNHHHQFVLAHNCRCPWCGVRERSPNVLLIHLHTCHPIYTYKVIKETTDDDTRTWLINVSFSKLSGNARDLAPFSFRSRKIKNLPVLNSKINNWSVEQLNKYLKPNSEKRRKTGFSSKTGLAMPEYQQNVDSDEEPCSLEWQNQWLGGLLDEFVDVSREEKRVIKLWNDHRMAFNHVSGDSQVPLILRAFLRDVIGRMTVQELDLPFMGCLVLHIYNLFHFGCLDLKNARDSLLIVQCLRSDPVKFLPLLSSHNKPQATSSE